MKDYITYLKFDDLTVEELLLEYNEKIQKKEKFFTLTPNLDFLRISYRNDNFRNLINRADYSLIDGKPIIWLAKLCKKKQFKYKISGSDFALNILELANQNGYKLALFGGKEGVPEKAKRYINDNYPNVQVVCTISPDFGYENDVIKSEKYINELNDSNADIYFLCTGTPKTELFFDSNKDEFGPGCYLSFGATIDFLAGNIKRAPKWMSNCGLEWLYRLSKDFKRLFLRYWFDFWFLLKIFFLIIFKSKRIINRREY